MGPFSRRLLIGLIAGALVASAAPSASARSAEKAVIRIDYEHNAQYSKTYPGMQESMLLENTDPEQCEQQPHCTHIPLDIVVAPGVSREYGWVVMITLRWPDARVDGTADSANLDLFVFRRQRDESTGLYERVSESTGRGRHPEVVRLESPDKEQYSIAVWNREGVNSEFSVAIEGTPNYPGITEEQSAPPPEAGNPSANSAGNDTAAVDEPGPDEGQFESAAPLPEATAQAGGTDAQALQLPDGGGRGSFEEALRGPGAPIDLLAGRRVPTGPPGPAHPLMLFLWLVAVPGGGTGALLYLIHRRRPASLRKGAAHGTSS